MAETIALTWIALAMLAIILMCVLWQVKFMKQAYRAGGWLAVVAYVLCAGSLTVLIAIYLHKV